MDTYKHDHSLVKIGVSLTTLKILLDVGTEVTQNISWSRPLSLSDGDKNRVIQLSLSATKIFIHCQQFNCVFVRPYNKSLLNLKIRKCLKPVPDGVRDYNSRLL